ncbi:ferredoxin [Sagittula sp. SSi028]|uniref:ferredoxin n=1 Tax=Sagittula sp. SSi028 TaxID=3400636 RepID=UPI003AF9CCC4
MTDLADTLRAVGLIPRAVVNGPAPCEVLPDDTRSIVLVGPDEPAFWEIFTASPEYRDQSADPLDRWSRRVLSPIAEQFGGKAILPSDGPPFAPFIQWALASGRCWSSPVGLLVHDVTGLFLSFRGAIALPVPLPVDAAPDSPCTGCHAPCLTACPVDALGQDTYDVPTCKAYLRTDDGKTCHQGCLVRRACPVSGAAAAEFHRLPVQSAFHMAAFMKE